MLYFESIHYAYHEVPVLEDLGFNAAPGEISCVVGPSGCGKSTLLGLAAGLLEVQRGEIRLNDTVLACPAYSLPPERRPVGLVFQEGALFPHLSVARNIGFGVAPDQRRARVGELLELVGLTAEAERLPHTLSGGQRQRVALARALAPGPEVLLFDEPYANLDQALRRGLRLEARDMVRRTGTTGVFVTHDPEDVMDLADQVIVLGDGALVQAGTPRELYDAPVSAQVAGLFGRTQILSGTIDGEAVQTPFGCWPRACIAEAAGAAPVAEGAPVRLCVRPEALKLAPLDSPGPDSLRVRELRMSGADDLAHLVNGEGELLLVRVPRPHPVQPADRVQLVPKAGSVFLFPA